MEIKPISKEDYKTLKAVAEQTYWETFSPLIPDADLKAYLKGAFNKEQLMSELQNKASQFFIAYADEQPVGYLKVNEGEANTESGFDDAMEVQRIYVLADYHRHGIGKQLMQKAIATAKTAGYHKLWLGVLHDDKRANGFYQAMGFKVVGYHDFIMGGVKVKDALLELEW